LASLASNRIAEVANHRVDSVEGGASAGRSSWRRQRGQVYTAPEWRSGGISRALISRHPEQARDPAITTAHVDR